MLGRAAPGRLAPSPQRLSWPPATGGTYYGWMGQESDRMISPTPRYYEIRGRAAEIARAVGSPAGGAEHLFLGMLHDGGWPVSVLSPLVDLAQAEEAVLAILHRRRARSPGHDPQAG